MKTMGRTINEPIKGVKFRWRTRGNISARKGGGIQPVQMKATTPARTAATAERACELDGAGGCGPLGLTVGVGTGLTDAGEVVGDWLAQYLAKVSGLSKRNSSPTSSDS